MNEEHYIVRNGMRVGNFPDYESAVFGLNHCEEGGILMSKSAWEERRKRLP